MADSRSPKGRNQRGGRRPGERTPPGRQRPTDPASGVPSDPDLTQQLNLPEAAHGASELGARADSGRAGADEQTQPRGIPLMAEPPAASDNASAVPRNPGTRTSGAVAGLWAGARRAFSSSGGDSRSLGSVRLRTVLDERSAQDRPRARFTARMAVLVLVLAVLTVMFASSLRAYVQQRDHLQELKAGNETLRQQNEQMDDEISRWEDPAYVRTQAREQLGYLFPGEQGFKVVGLDGEADESSLPTPQPVEKQRTPWWDDAWASVELAGNPPRPKKPYDPNTTINGTQQDVAEGTSKQ